MAATKYRITLSLDQGPVITELVAQLEPITDEPAPAPRGNASSDGRGAEDRMTEPQMRYLFRLLAAQGVEGKAAEAHLKDHFKVKTLREVSRQAASQLIDQMVRDQKEVGGGKA
jgi:hypothetical protein